MSTDCVSALYGLFVDEGDSSGNSAIQGLERCRPTLVAKADGIARTLLGGL